MSQEQWETVFEIKQNSAFVEDGDLGSFHKLTYDLVNIHNGEVVANYRDYSYAKKQARRRYKKLVKLMEKSFMSLT